MCVGETLEQRETGITTEWITMQIKAGFNGVAEDKIRKMIIAYEPIWAIGTGKTATPSRRKRSARASVRSSARCTARRSPARSPSSTAAP